MTNQSLVRGRARLNLLQVIRFSPYLFLWIDSFSFVLYKMDIYRKLYDFLLPTSGHSVLWVIYTSMMLYLLKPCKYTWVCMISLLMFNILSLFPVSELYYTYFMIIIIFTGISMSTILIVHRWIKSQYITL